MRFIRTRAFQLMAYLSAAVAVAGDQNITIDDLSTSVVLSPLEVWAWSKQGSMVNNGTFSFSNDEAATAVFSFPRPATAVYWQGFKRSGAATYSVCVDCPANPRADDPRFEAVDANDPKVQSSDPATILFSKTGLSDAFHNLTIKNHLDPRFTNMSQITVDAFIITSTVVQPSVTEPSLTSLPPGPSPTDAPGRSKTVTPTPSPSKAGSFVGLSTPATIGIIIGVVVAILAAGIALFCFLRSRRKRYTKLGAVDMFYPNNDGSVSPMVETLDLLPRDKEQSDMVTPPSSSASDFPPRRQLISPLSASPSPRHSPYLQLPVSAPRVSAPRPRGSASLDLRSALARHESYLGVYPSSSLVPSSSRMSRTTSMSSYADSSTHSLYSAPTNYSSVRYSPSHSSISSIPIGLSNPFASPFDDSMEHLDTYQLAPVDATQGAPTLSSVAGSQRVPLQRGQPQWVGQTPPAQHASMHIHTESLRPDAELGFRRRGVPVPPPTASLRISGVLEVMQSLMSREGSTSGERAAPSLRPIHSPPSRPTDLRGHGRAGSSPTFI